MDQQTDTPTDTSTIAMPKVPAYPSVDSMSTEKVVDPSTNQHQIHGLFSSLIVQLPESPDIFIILM